MQDLIVGRDGKVGLIRLARPPHNFFDAEMLGGIADTLAANDADPDIVVTLISAEGRSFCAGANFAGGFTASGEAAQSVYSQAKRIFGRKKPLIAAVGGPAVGGGLGLAVAADLRIASPSARFHCNFSSIGLHPGFALTVTLPALIGAQKALDIMLTSRRVGGEEAVAIGLADRLAAVDTLDDEALEFARSLAGQAPLALRSIREALPRVDIDAAAAAMANELIQQELLFKSLDFQEGVRAVSERRPPAFAGR